MRLRFADKDEMKIGEPGAAAERLMGVEVIAQQGGLEWSVESAVVFQPTFGGGDFAILLGLAACLPAGRSCGVINSGRKARACGWPGATMTGVTALW